MPYFYLKKAKFWAKILGSLPGVEAIFLSGSLAQNRGNIHSDIDFFVIATPGKIWTARFFVFLVLKISGNLAKPHHHAGKICPNHFITTNSLEIKEKDAYSAQLFSHNIPLYDPKNIFDAFRASNECWMQKFGKTFSKPFPPTKTQKNIMFEGKNGKIERILKFFQIKKIRKNTEYKTPGAKIVLTKTELRFHPHPKNKEL